MLSSEEYQNFEAEVETFFGGRNSQEDFKKLFCNEEQFPKFQSVLFYPDATPRVIHFALCGISYLIDYIFVQWTMEDFLGLSRQFLELAYNKIDKFDDNASLVSKAFCRMYATMALYGWNTSSEFATFIHDIEQFFNASFHHYRLGLMLCNDIVKKMEQLKYVSTKQLEAFKDDTMGSFLNYAFNTFANISNGAYNSRFSQDEQSNLRLNSLELLITLLEFNYNEKINTENANSQADQKKVEIPQKWIATVSFDQLITYLYEIYGSDNEEMQKGSLEVLCLLAATQRRSCSTENIKFKKDVREQIFASSVINAPSIYSFFRKLISGVSEIVEKEIHLDKLINVQKICSIIARIRNSVDPQFLVEMDFERLVQAAAKLTFGIFNVEFISENHETVMDIMKFWRMLGPIATYTTRDSKNNLIQPNLHYVDVLKEIFQHYISLIMNFINENPTGAINVLFGDFKEISNIIAMTHFIGVIDIECLKQIIDAFIAERNNFFTHLNDPNLLVIEVRMIFFAFCVVSFLTTQKMNNITTMGNLREFFEFYTSALLQLIADTGNLISNSKGGPALTERAVLLIINQLSNTLIIKGANISPDIPDYIKENNGMNLVQDVVALVLRRIFLSTTTFPNDPVIVSIAVSALEKYITNKENQFIDEAILVVFVNEFLNFDKEDQFQFLFVPENSLSRVTFYSIISSIMIRMWPKSEKFQGVVQRIVDRIATYNTTLNEDYYVLDFLSLRGLFQGSTDNNHYLNLISFFYPATIETMISHIDECPAAVPHLMEFLNELVSNTNSRIAFPKHSPLGLLMFKTVSNALTTFFNNIEYSNFEHFVTPCQMAVYVMTKILRNPESNIGAIEVYEDPILNKLFIAFLGMAERLNYTEFNNYPEVSSALMDLITTIFAEFADYVIQNKPQFIVEALKVADNELNNAIGMKLPIQNALTAIGSIASFSYQSIGVPEFLEYFTLMKPIFENILVVVETQMILCSNSNIIKTLVDFVQLIIQLGLENWPLVRKRLRLFFDNNKREEVKVILSAILMVTEEELEENGE